MPLQNRVAPTGEILALAGRGTMMGNRGVLNDAHRHLVRHSAVRRWIACLLSFKDRKLEVMAPNRYTQLFFLDEATAFAAGHRPCAECRREDYLRFRALWTARFGNVSTIDAVDDVLHAERLDGKVKRTWRGRIERLPYGTYVTIDGVARVIRADVLAAWTDAGYVDAIRRPAMGEVVVLTPRSIVTLFDDGYVPAYHPSLDAVTVSGRTRAALKTFPSREGVRSGT